MYFYSVMRLHGFQYEPHFYELYLSQDCLFLREILLFLVIYKHTNIKYIKWHFLKYLPNFYFHFNFFHEIITESLL